MRRWAAGLLAALALAGCGSSGLSGGQRRAAATRICTLAAQRLRAIALAEAPAAGRRFLIRGIAVLGPEVSQLRALGATGLFGEGVTASSAELAALRFTVRGLRAGNDPVVAIKTLQQRLVPLEARANGAWRRLGISACVSR